MQKAFFGGLLGATLATAIGLFGQITQPSTVQIGRCDLRATLTSGTAVTAADVTAATNVYVTPKDGGQCSFYNGASWDQVSGIAEITVPVPATTSTPYDIFCYNNGGVAACETANWSSDSARATALTTQNGVYVKSGTTTRRYIATARTTTVSGQTEDSFAKRYLWNYYNRVPRAMRVVEATDSWAYNGVFRQARATATNQLDFVVGVAEVAVQATVSGYASGNATSNQIWVAIGEDSTTTPDAGCLVAPALTINSGFGYSTTGRLDKIPAAGRHAWVWLEKGGAATTTWYGDNGADGTLSGISGVIQG